MMKVGSTNPVAQAIAFAFANLIVLVFGCGFALADKPTGSPIVDQCLDEFQSSPPDSIEQLLSGTRLYFALAQFNFVEAHEQAQLNLELATRLGHSNGQALAHLQIARCLIHQMKSKAAREHFSQAVSLYEQPSMGSRFELAYVTLKYGYEKTDLDMVSSDLGQSLSHFKSAMERTKDDHSLFWGRVMLLATLVFDRKASVETAEVKSLRQSIEQTCERYGFYYGRAYSQIAFCSMLLNQGDMKACQRELTRAKQLVEKSGSRELMILQSLITFRCHVANANPKEANQTLREIIEHAKLIRSDEFQFMFATMLGRREFAAGNTKLSRKLFEQLQTDFTRKPFRLVTLDNFYRWGMNLAKAEGDIDRLYEYGQLLSSPEHRNAIAISTTNYRALDFRFKELERDKRKREQEFIRDRLALEQTRDVAEQKVSQLRSTLFWILGSIALLSIGGLGVCFYGRMRNQLLDGQREVKRERQLRSTAEKRLVRMERMESLGLLAGGIAHDFNNLLVGVMGNAELLSAKPDGGREFVEKRADQILKASGKAADLSRQMLAYSGRGFHQKATCDLNELVQKLQPVFESRVGDVASVVVDVADAPIFVSVDGTQIDQVILNLVSNARRVSNHQQNVHVRIRTEQLTDEMVVSGKNIFGTRATGGNFGCIEIQDHGPGIPESQVENIFDPFFGDSEDGRGLGLAVVYGLISSHDGLIRIETSSQGTSMQALLPLVVEHPEKRPQQKAPQPHFGNRSSKKQGKSKLLIVDDEPAVLEWISSLGSLEEVEVHTCNNAQTAIQTIESCPPDAPFTCVVTDMFMPEISGPELLESLEQRGLNIPAVIMSGHRPGQLKQLNRLKNVIGVIEKPFSASELLELIRSKIQAKNASRR